MAKALRTFATRAAYVPQGRVKIIECPRDAIQGLKKFVETGNKIKYINALLHCGFDTIDFGSFVAAPVVPQMRDTAEVLDGLDLGSTSSKLLAIIANVKGAQRACQFPQIQYLGFPLSVSEEFQRRNTNKTISEALKTVNEIQQLCVKNNKQLVVYLSMGFGNPYGEPYDPEVVKKLVTVLDKDMGVSIISLADTIGCSEPELITRLFTYLVPRYPHIEFGAHFHSQPTTAYDKVKAAFDAGVRRLDGALGGMGGCPFAKAALVGNVATETIIRCIEAQGQDPGVNHHELHHASDIRTLLFGVSVKELVLATVLSDETQFREMARSHFDAANTDQTGLVNFEQFKDVLNRTYAELGETAHDDDHLRYTFNRYDEDKDGFLSFDEYLKGARKGLHKRLRTM